ncbi:hypothetical protein LIER_23747 [Lithospermum erythrorhizon]|uniref:Uncharacterized protein n=1 Tax=Lithospermum erythrorhizon TaxID=34254 RepID=A0AAV3R043_LITER
MAIPQDVVRDIANLLNDAQGEEPFQATEVLSIEPLAIDHSETVPANPPSTQQPSTQQAPLSTHEAGTSHTGDDRDFSKRKAEDTAQKLKAAEEMLPG